ncbi:hypothetical protein BIY29_07495 [Brenneria alni]|uniref:Uncharacterized protein n=1 Tax=Brenneria alni TaxID=71656 RepID=A0A421DQ59_9GAMM|nr:hypothetical protein BIY29_07495 [Brenneria alni]
MNKPQWITLIHIAKRNLRLEMADAGIILDRSEAALARWAKRETGIDSLQWLSSQQASVIIEKLKQWQRRTRITA